MKKMLSMLLTLALLMTMAFAAVPAYADEIKDLNTYQITANEVETWNILYSQKAQDLQVGVNLVDGLLTNDSHGKLVGNAAKEYSTTDGSVWTFVLNEGMKWTDAQGNVKADVVANDWVVAMEWILNFAKNDSMNTEMPIQMIKGAAEYYEYTKELATTEGTEAAWNISMDKFNELVGVKALNDTTLEYTLVEPLAYFPSVATYNCLYPLAAGMVEELGVEGVRALTPETMWYSGPYTITAFVHQNEKVYTKNPNYWNKDIKVFDSVTVKMVESVDVAYGMFQTGELDNVELSASMLNSISNSPSHEFNGNLVEGRQTKYSMFWVLCYDKMLEDGTPDTNWNTAIANANFRKAIYYGLDMTPYLTRQNAIKPLVSTNYTYTSNAVAVNSQGVDYTQLVRDEIGLQLSTETYNRYQPELAAEYKAKAIEELTAKGVTFPVEMVYYAQASNQVNLDNGATVAQMFSDCLGDDFIKFTVKTFVSNQTAEVVTPQLGSVYMTGWGADYADPMNFMATTTDDDAAFFTNNYCMFKNNNDPELQATLAEFNRLVDEANAITDNNDERYAAMAKAEAYYLNNALAIPSHVQIPWQLTCINDYSKPYASYGIQNYRYVGWETNSNIYTSAEYDVLAAN